MAADSEADVAETLVVRREAVAALAEGEMTIRELEERTDVSRATAHRVLTRLDEQAVVERTDRGGYALTAYGTAVVDELESYTNQIQVATDLQPLLGRLASAPVEFDLAWFSDARISRASTKDPYGPVERFSALAAEATTERVLNDTLIAPREIVEEADERLDSGVAHTMILSSEALALYRERHPDIVEESFARGNATTLVADEIPLDLTLFDERLLLPRVDSATGVVSMLVDTGDADAMAWGEAVFEACREDATPIETVLDENVE